MTIQIAIVENEREHMIYLNSLLSHWSEIQQTKINIIKFSSGLDLLQSNFTTYHLIFLDIELDETSGITIAQALRKRKYHGELVFTTSYNEYVFDGYDVHALNYLLKPISYKKIERVMAFITEQTANNYFYYTTKTCALQLLYRDIISFNSYNHYVEVKTINGSEIIRGPLKSLLPLLPPQFIQCHRTSIVNLFHIKKIDKHIVYLTQDVTVPISQSYQKKFQESFLEFIHKRI